MKRIAILTGAVTLVLGCGGVDQEGSEIGEMTQEASSPCHGAVLNAARVCEAQVLAGTPCPYRDPFCGWRVVNAQCDG